MISSIDCVKTNPEFQLSSLCFFFNWSVTFLSPCWPINNDNRTERSPTRSVIIRVINKIGRPRSGSLICLPRVRLLTELDDKKSCYRLIITISISEKTNTPKTNISSGDNVFSWIFSILEIVLFFFGWVVVSMVIVLNSVIGGSSWVDIVWLAASTVRLQPTVWLHCPITSVQND